MYWRLIALLLTGNIPRWSTHEIMHAEKAKQLQFLQKKCKFIYDQEYKKEGITYDHCKCPWRCVPDSGREDD